MATRKNAAQNTDQPADQAEQLEGTLEPTEGTEQPTEPTEPTEQPAVAPVVNIGANIAAAMNAQATLDSRNRKPPAAPKGLSRRQKQAIVMAKLMHAAGDVAEQWNVAETGVSVEDALDLLVGRLQYTPGTCWDARLGDRPVLVRTAGQ